MRTTAKIFAATLLLASAASALAAVHYVDVNGTNATPPYTNWSTAATNIQDAVDAAVAGDEIVVTNGTYHPVAANKPLNVRSVSGPQFTLIDGSGGNSRCVYLADAASLSGFTLANGFVEGELYGGGAFGGTLNNCTLRNNRASYDVDTTGAKGGGAAYCTLNNCTLTGNSAIYPFYSFGAAYGGGAYQCTLNNCTLSGNRAENDCGGGFVDAPAYGGGAFECILNNCVLTGNSVSGCHDSLGGGGLGGGAYNCTLNNCTLTGNSANRFGGGAYSGTLNNCIVYFNTNGGNYGGGLLTINYCCTTPLSTSGVGNITNAPLFVDTNAWSNLRLQSNSPCINAGNNSYVTNATDLDGNPRIAGGTVDLGAYEFQAPASMISYAWLQRFNLPINPATDTADPDGDGVNNYREWLAGSDPTNPFSFPPLLTLIPYGANIILTWPTNAVGFTLQSTTNLSSPALWSTNSPGPIVIGGQNVVINPLSGPQQFFRLVQ